MIKYLIEFVIVLAGLLALAVLNGEPLSVEGILVRLFAAAVAVIIITVIEDGIRRVRGGGESQ